MKQNIRIARHGLLRGAAAASVLVAGGAVYCAASEGVFSVGQGPAYEPWRMWRADASDGPRGDPNAFENRVVVMQAPIEPLG